MKLGDPLDPATNIGPVVSQRQRDRIEGYLDAGKAAGAKAAVGGGRPKQLPKGWYIEPTVFANVDNSMKIAQEEIFGPVLAVIPYGSEDEAIAIANDSPVRPVRLGLDAATSSAAPSWRRACAPAAWRSTRA